MSSTWSCLGSRDPIIAPWVKMQHWKPSWSRISNFLVFNTPPSCLISSSQTFTLIYSPTQTSLLFSPFFSLFTSRFFICISISTTTQISMAKKKKKKKEKRELQPKFFFWIILRQNELETGVVSVCQTIEMEFKFYWEWMFDFWDKCVSGLGWLKVVYQVWSKYIAQSAVAGPY